MTYGYEGGGTPGSTETLRLTFHFDHDQVELVNVVSVRMVTPPSLGCGVGKPGSMLLTCAFMA